MAHPHWDWFIGGIAEERIWGQVLIRRLTGRGAGFELCHVLDRAAKAEALRWVAVGHLREVSRSAADGRYRPLKGAPNLPSGWRSLASNDSELAHAVDQLYPGSLGDAWAASVQGFAAQDFAVIAGRQLGRSKVLQNLRGVGLAAAVSAGCSPRACLKRRLWGGEGVAAEEASAKSDIPCLEPCPFFLGFARTCAEIEQTATVPVEFAPDDLATLAAALRHALDHPPRGLREGEIAEPLHPLRVARVLARHPDLRFAVAPLPSTTDE